MKRILPIFCLMMASLLAMAQELTVTGVVMAEGEPDPVIGANVMVKGTSTGTITDFDGNFTISAKKGATLVISYMGYETQELPVTSAGPLRVTLKSDSKMLDEVVAVGYGTMKKSDLTGAVTSVSADALVKAPVSGLDQALQGRAAGVTVTTGSGQPGQAATIRIRGIGSAMGGNDPLYVVDGVITSDISFIAPNDIQSMEILKDASATAIYGSRGANGVIIVTTKNGSEGKVNVSFDAYWGIQNRWRKLDLMGPIDQAETELKIYAMRNGAEEIGYYYQYKFAEWLKSYKLGKSEYYPTNFDYASQVTDWQDEVFNPNAFMQNYNLSLDGGNDKMHYALSTSYFSQDGTIIGSNYDRFTLRLNTDFQVYKWLKVGEHLSLMVSSGRNAMNNSSSAGASIISAALAMGQWDPVYYPEDAENKYHKDPMTGENKQMGGYYSAGSNFKNVTNPYQMAFNSEPKNKDERIVGDLFVEITPVKGLTIKSSLSADYKIGQSRNFQWPNIYTSYNKPDEPKNFISASLGRYCTMLEETTITYARQIEKHNFSVMVGQTWSEYNYYSFGGSGSKILNPTENNWYVNNATEDRLFDDSVGRTRRMSFLGRVFYNYDSRYMITANFRADASSKFRKNPWGFFPSVALAWRLSEEHFIKDLELSWLDNIKVRAGFGQVGNDGVGTNAFVATMEGSDKVFYGYPLGNNQTEASYGAAVLTQANVDGRWETNQQWDAGIDFSFWNGKLSGAVDYFCRDTKDALLYVTAPAHVGNWGSPVKNVGNIRNDGFELTLNHDNQVGKVHYNIGGNISFLHNELTKLNGGSPLWGDRTKTDEGMALNSFWGYTYEGVYQSDEEVLDHLYSYKEDPSTCGIHAGDAKYRDLNGDGKIDEDDKSNLGNAFPKITYGFNLGADFYGVDVQLFFQGVAGNKIYNALRERLEGDGTANALATYMKDEAWIGYTDVVRDALLDEGVNWMELENRNGSVPNPLGSPTNTENSTRFLESGAYLRLKNAQIGYTLPKDITKKFHCSRLRFYVTASNLFTITKYTGYDPEVGGGVDYGNYPQSRTFTFGLNANF